MANKYLEKLANDHVLRGHLMGARSQERAIARDHGKHVPFSVMKHLEEDGKRQMAINDDIVRGMGTGAALGTIGGMAYGAFKKKVNPLASVGVGAMSGFLAGDVIANVRSSHKYLKRNAEKAHKKYSK